MLTALVFVCSLAATPDLAACYLAQTEIGRDLGADDRVKVICMPSKMVETTIRPALVR